MSAAIGVDVGGTNIRVALVDDQGTVLEQARASTPLGDPEALADAIAPLVLAHDEGLPIGVGIAGAVTSDGRVLFSPNGDLEDADLGTPLRRAVGRSFVVVNDATVAAWGEHRVGAGQGIDDVVLVTLGTGVGGGAVVGGRLLRGANGLAGEFGHQVIAAGGASCPCGDQGCLEAYGAGRHIALGDRRAGEVAEAAAAGDEEAAAHLAAVGRWIGLGVSNLVDLFDPGIVLVGGGAGQAAFDGLADHITTAISQHIFGRGHRPVPPVRAAALGDDAGVVGAALLALHDGSPA